MKRIALAIIFAAAGSTMAQAIETITYTYDAQGRLVTVVHSGTVNNTVTATYGHDNADNRTNVATTS